MRSSNPESRLGPASWGYLALGLLTAPVFALTPVLGFMGWFLGSLCHEMGHSAVSWCFGMPAFPAIRLDGHAASIHQDQVLVLALAAWAALGALAWARREHKVQAIALGVVTLLYPAFAFTGGKELLHLLGGHLGELAMACYCFVLVLDGGFTQGPVERALYGTLGWHLLGRNVLLCVGLVFRREAREAYSENGSFGLANDYIRVAEDVLGWSLPGVAMVMLLVCLVPLPSALWIWISRHEGYCPASVGLAEPWSPSIGGHAHFRPDLGPDQRDPLANAPYQERLAAARRSEAGQYPQMEMAGEGQKAPLAPHPSPIRGSPLGSPRR